MNKKGTLFWSKGAGQGTPRPQKRKSGPTPSLSFLLVSRERGNEVPYIIPERVHVGPSFPHSLLTNSKCLKQTKQLASLLNLHSSTTRATSFDVPNTMP